jgi:hypothetical protein
MAAIRGQMANFHPKSSIFDPKLSENFMELDKIEFYITCSDLLKVICGFEVNPVIITEVIAP